MLEHPFDIFGSVYIRPGRLHRIGYADFEAVFQCTQLLQLFGAFERRGRQRSELQQRANAISVDANVPARAGTLASTLIALARCCSSLRCLPRLSKAPKSWSNCVHWKTASKSA